MNRRGSAARLDSARWRTGSWRFLDAAGYWRSARPTWSATAWALAGRQAGCRGDRTALKEVLGFRGCSNGGALNIRRLAAMARAIPVARLRANDLLLSRAAADGSPSHWSWAHRMGLRARRRLRSHGLETPGALFRLAWRQRAGGRPTRPWPLAGAAAGLDSGDGGLARGAPGCGGSTGQPGRMGSALDPVERASPSTTCCSAAEDDHHALELLTGWGWPARPLWRRCRGFG